MLFMLGLFIQVVITLICALFSQKRQGISLLQRQVRAFGGPAGDPNHKYVMDKVDSSHTTYKHPSQHDIDYQLPKEGIFNEKFHAWVAGKWAVDRDEMLTNDKVQKYSAYNMFNTVPMLRNGILWKFAAIFGNRSRDADNSSGLAGIQTHENGVHLYKSPDARYVSARHISDYATVFFGLYFLSGNFLAVMPLFLLAIQTPRKVSSMAHFCWHAELLPHTEQVVFHKSTMFGGIKRTIVDIENLEKIGSDQVRAPLMWMVNMFDPDLIFRDTASREIFVFDKNGHWNAEALEHPLLY